MSYRCHKYLKESEPISFKSSDDIIANLWQGEARELLFTIGSVQRMLSNIMKKPPVKKDLGIPFGSNVEVYELSRKDVASLKVLEDLLKKIKPKW